MTQTAVPGKNPGAVNSAVPDSNTLLAYKLLQESWKDGQVFQDLLQNEMKYLVAGISLLNNDPYLAMKMGGVTLNSAGQLAQVIKQKATELDLSKRIEPVASEILKHEFGKPNMLELAPQRRTAVYTENDGKGALQLHLAAGSFAGTGLDMRPSSGVNTSSDKYTGGGIKYGTTDPHPKN